MATSLGNDIRSLCEEISKKVMNAKCTVLTITLQITEKTFKVSSSSDLCSHHCAKQAT